MIFITRVNGFIAAFLIFTFALSSTNGEGEKSTQDDLVQVEIPQGLLQGKVLTSREGKKFFGFMGIPFSEAPDRFKVIKYWQ